MEDSALGDTRDADDVDNRQLYHESAAQMRRAQQQEEHRSAEASTQQPGGAESEPHADFPGRTDQPNTSSSGEAVNDSSPISRAAASPDALQQSREAHREEWASPIEPGPVKITAQAHRHTDSLKKTVRIQDTSNIVGDCNRAESSLLLSGNIIIVPAQDIEVEELGVADAEDERLLKWMAYCHSDFQML